MRKKIDMQKISDTDTNAVVVNIVAIPILAVDVIIIIFFPPLFLCSFCGIFLFFLRL